MVVHSKQAITKYRCWEILEIEKTPNQVYTKWYSGFPNTLKLDWAPVMILLLGFSTEFDFSMELALLRNFSMALNSTG